MTGKPKRGRPATGNAMTSAQRQAAYRQRCDKGLSGASKLTNDPQQGVKRLDVLLPFEVGVSVARLAKYKGLSKAALIAQLVTEAESNLTAKMSDDECERYFVTR